jgi:hypothetical protein
MRELRLAFLRNGASSVRLHEKLEERSVFRLEAVTPTWREHLRMKERLTKAEREVLDRVLALNGAPKSEVGHYVLVTRDLLAAGSLRPANDPSDWS